MFQYPFTQQLFSEAASKLFTKKANYELIFNVGAVLIVLLFIAKWDTSLPTPIIQTESGKVQGIIGYSISGHEYWQFLGIPYGVVAKGPHKYLPPVPVKPWEGVKLVNKYSAPCVQYAVLFNLKTLGSMDCLHLNVFVHQGPNSGNRLKPVLVYVFGGGFVSGATSMFRPDYFMEHDIILVTMNYRLGPYGFLNLEELNGPHGNLALFDQLLVLKWIQKNIEKFGGDPAKVCLMGNSAGGVMTHFHILSPLSQGLFSRAIIQSASALAPWAIYQNPKRIATEYAKRLGCSVENSTVLLDCYETSDWRRLIGSQHKLADPLLYTDMFNPTVDGVFVNDTPNNILKSGKFAKVPVMFGVTMAEGIIGTAKFINRPELITQFENDWPPMLSNVMFLENQLTPKTANKIRKAYFGKEKDFAVNQEGFIKNLTTLGSHCQFWYPMEKAAALHAKNGAPTYLYYHNYTSKIFPGSYSVLRSVTPKDWLMPEITLLLNIGVDWIKEFVLGVPTTFKYGTGHSDDLMIQWNFEGFTKYFSGPDMHFRSLMIQAIVDFANHTAPLKFNGMDWPKVDDHGKHLQYMVFDDKPKPTVVSNLLGDKRAFWNKMDEANWLNWK